ncbi:MAG: DUF2927 domain-containing protein [Pseudomonadota bacterium]
MARELCVRDYFLRVTLGNNYERHRDETLEPLITKAVQPVRITVILSDDISKAIANRVTDTLESTIAIARAAGVDLHFWDRDPVVPANLFIFVSHNVALDQEDSFADPISRLDRGVAIYEALRGTVERPNEDCAFVSLSADGRTRAIPGDQQDGGLKLGVALIPTTLDRKAFHGCLVEETLQILGLSYDFRGVVRSTFKDAWNGPSSPTVFDFMLLRLLYHPLMEPGMTEDNVTDIFSKAYSTIISSQPRCESVDDCLEVES